MKYKNCPCNVEDPTLSKQSAHRWRQGCEPYAPAALCSPETLFFCFWYSFLLVLLVMWEPSMGTPPQVTKIATEVTFTQYGIKATTL
jgi:hypothetical protein